MICRTCGKQMRTLRDYKKAHLCRLCYNKYMRDYGKTRRWLNGADRTDDLGPELNIGISEINREACVYVRRDGRRERLA